MILTTVGRQPVRVTETLVGQEVTVCGRLDVSSVDQVRLALYDILDRGVGDLLVHLAQAEVHDAAGLGVIVGIHHRARRVGRRLVLVDVSPRLDRLLRASRLHRVLARGSGKGVVTATPADETAVPLTETAVPLTETAVPLTETAVPLTETVVPVTETVVPGAESVGPCPENAEPGTDTVVPFTG
jgi:anti-sigma B factor antagonist